MCDAFDLNNGKVADGVVSWDHQKSKLWVLAGADGFRVRELRVWQVKIGRKSCFVKYIMLNNSNDSVTYVLKICIEYSSSTSIFFSLMTYSKVLNIRFCSKSPTFGQSYRTRNILTRFCSKSPTFGHSYRTRNISPRFCRKTPTFGHSNRTRNILT